MSDCNTAAVPMNPKEVLSPAAEGSTAPAERRVWYQSAVGSLMYLMICTRPDIAYAVSQLSRFSANPEESHVGAVRTVFRYLKGTKHYGMTFDSTKSGLLGYTDANWARDHDRRSTGGYVFTLCGTAVSWSSKRQATVALSSCEAEYMAETEAAKEAIWLSRLMRNFDAWKDGPVEIRGDNMGALAMAHNPEFHARSKHIDIRYHFVRQKVDEGLIKMTWVSTGDNLADIMTKPLSGPTFEGLRKGLGLRPVEESE